MLARSPSGSPISVARLHTDYLDKDLVIVPVLKGSYVFAADLVRHIDLDVAIDFLGVRSYGNEQKTSGVVQITTDLSRSIEGKHVILVEDIVDTGLTVSYLYENLATRQPASLKIGLVAPQTRAHPRARSDRLPRFHPSMTCSSSDTASTTGRNSGICPTWRWSPTTTPKRPILGAVDRRRGTPRPGRTDSANRFHNCRGGRQAPYRRGRLALDSRYGGTLARSHDGTLGPKTPSLRRFLGGVQRDVLTSAGERVELSASLGVSAKLGTIARFYVDECRSRRGADRKQRRGAHRDQGARSRPASSRRQGVQRRG